jgi:hypothetical protein
MATYHGQCIINDWFCSNCKINLGHAKFFCRGQGLTDFGKMQGVNVLNSGTRALLGGISRCA